MAYWDSVGTTHRLDYIFLRARADTGRVGRRLEDCPPRRRLSELLVAWEQDRCADRPAVSAVGQYCLDVSHSLYVGVL